MKLSGCIVVGCAVVLGACGSGASTPLGPDLPSVRPRVLAFYYPWYGRPDGPSGRWYHWNPSTERHDATNTPTLGLYDSNDSMIVRQHIVWAKLAGVDAFIASWWGPSSFENRSLGVLVQVAEREQFTVTALIENPFTRDQLRNELRTLIGTHATSPAWLRVDGQPVVLVYDRIMNRFGPDDFRYAFDGAGAFMLADSHDPVKAAPFDGVFSYGPVQDVAGYLRELPSQRAAHHAEGRILVAATLPGYDDRVLRQPGRFIPRNGGELYRSMWTAASVADWVTITSWNEWHEGTEIEPSVEYGTSYLHLTRTLAEDWRRSKQR